MMNRAVPCGLVVSVLAMLIGCQDSTSPNARGDSIEIYHEGVEYDEQTFATGSTIELSARVFDATGEPIEGQTASWSSDRPEVASVDVASGGAVVVTAHAPGTAFIVARNAVGEDSAKVNVAVGIPRNQLPVCSPDDALELGPGEHTVVSGAETLPICLGPGASGAAEYALIVVNSGTTAGATLPVQLRSVGTGEADGPPSPDLRALPISTRTVRDAEFHSRLREQVSERLEPRLRAGLSLQPTAPRLQISTGQSMNFNVETTSSDGCSSPAYRTGTVRAISDHAIVVADDLNPNGGFTDAEYASFGAFFDDHAWPVVTGNFGEPSDTDGNGRVIIFFTRAVNALVQNQAGHESSYVGGFFFNRDLFPKSSCGGSNAAEMFYMLVPNPTPGPQERSFTKEFVARGTRTVLVHEFQHLVNDSRRLHINRSPVWEETWLSEGLSHIAEELMFYRASGLSPDSNLDGSDFASNQAREAFRLYQIDNLDRYRLFLQGPEYASLMGDDLLGTRGATWAFLRYAADRNGSGESAFWRSLVSEARTAGLTNLRQAIDDEPTEWIRDWAAAIYLDDTGFDNDPRHSINSWNMRDLFEAAPTLWPGLVFGSEYPLRVSHLVPGVTIPLELKGGGAGYTRASVRPGEVGSVRLVIAASGQDYLPAPSRVQVVVVRTQ